MADSLAGIVSGLETSTVYQREQAQKADAAAGNVSTTDFLVLLTKQLTTQDPMNPMEDIDFTAQLAQLQALDSQMELTKTMTAMRADTQLQAGTTMIGKFVNGVDQAGATISGQVEKVTQQDGAVFVQLTSGNKIPVGNIANVWENAQGMVTDLGSAANLVDMWVEAGIDPDTKQQIKGIVESVSVSNGQTYLKLYGGETVALDSVKSMRQPTSEEVYYLLPDKVRKQVEDAQQMQFVRVTAIDANGNRTSGIVQGAELDEANGVVYLNLYGGKQVPMNDLQKNTESDLDPRDPTAAEIKNDLTGYYCIGLNGQGKSVSGQITDVKEYQDGIALVLHNGQEVYWDAKTNIREPSEEELAEIAGEAEAA